MKHWGKKSKDTAESAQIAEEVQAAEERLRERFAHQLSQQWQQVREMREARRLAESSFDSGPSNFNQAQVPWAYDLAAAWAWRFLVITAAGLVVLYGLSYFSVIVFPIIIAMFLAALTAPLVTAMGRIGISRQIASLIVVFGGLSVITLLLIFVGQQIAAGADDLSTQVADGLGEIETWLRTGPLNASDSQINSWIADAQNYIETEGKDLAKNAGEVSATVGHILAGFFIVLFSMYFFLADGDRIWAWLVRIFPRAARTRADSSGRIAWHSLTQFVRATVMVAAVDAIGIAVIAAILGVPFVGAIGVLVFLGSFVPLIGALFSGAVAVLVALVAQGPVVALIMLAGVVLVQQVEAHILQPFLMGRFVSVHPLGVILSIAAGVLVAGVAGALVAVPLAAALNAVVQHLAAYTEVGEPADDAQAQDPLPDPETDPEVVADADDAPRGGGDPA